MTYIVPEITLATRDDIVGILDLQDQNLLGRGGLLSVRLPGAFIKAALDDLPQIVARRDGKIVGYLLAGSRGLRTNPNHTGDVPCLSEIARYLRLWPDLRGGDRTRARAGNCLVRGIARAAAGARMRRLCPTRQCRIAAGASKNGDESCGLVRA